MSIATLQEKTFHTYASWLNYGFFTNEALVNSPMLLAPFDAYRHQPLFKASCLAIKELLYCIQDTRQYLPTIKIILPRVFALRNEYKIALQNENENAQVRIQYNTIQFNTIQYNTIQYNTIQYNTIQNNT